MNLATPVPSCTRVLIVDDSAFMRTALSRMINCEPSFEVVGTAWSGSDALHKIPLLDPNVVTLDLQMQGLDGLDTLRQIMSHFPRPVIVVSATAADQAEVTMQALSLGAFDYVPKQLSSTSLEISHIQVDLMAKLSAAAESCRPSASVIRGKPVRSIAGQGRTAPSLLPNIIGMGASTGGPRALEQILAALPRDLQVPIAIVQHMPIGFTATFARRLDSICKLAVHEAVHGERLQPGVVYLAPAGAHMLVERSSRSHAFVSLTAQPSDAPHRPSIDVLMKSIAASFGERGLGIILSGMGSDGAEGMKSIYQAGGLTIGQDEASCVVYGMPRACAELGVLHRSVPLPLISAQILTATQYRKRA
ncbi:MAG TPA: chemotaxis response regulator protein-glutamate methylesterase [Candidatus Sulfotelmatobacter sp.]|nr:chemotaxis response regulator protein-glutamate methylesterase [Candidatus Sulfotelmatobacter sp.]